ncbi:ImmA/IrrE family metallo-endopeptidase [uncultured Photobacterium sp.]|uniref:ImmA/IrrE family metallo-endopeptidase n=1 Tax=uncultured Photobacterium sp. TaxID=173973 RepID=UPI00262C292A|nr:ImmA/IrrE family metallo-endopeptidase [uncultured Photobacterium sp.]
MYKRKLGTKVDPQSKDSIRKIAQEARDGLGIRQAKVNIVALLETLQSLDEIEIEIIEDHEFSGCEEAIAYPDRNFIQVKNSIYESASNGCGHSIFTLAHEFGHLILHKDQKPSFARGEHKIFEDSEWQADTFASEFLMDSRHIEKGDDAKELVKKFGVTHHAAQVRISKL